MIVIVAGKYHMKLSDEVLPNFFKNNPNAPALAHVKYPYNFASFSQNAKTLIVTIGDSWTFGADIIWNDPCGVSRDTIPERINQCYGGLISQELNADFLNLGQSGTSNQQITDRLLELEVILPQLEYDNVVVICVYTEAARAILAIPNYEYWKWTKGYAFDTLEHFDKFIEFNNTYQQHILVDFIARHPDIQVIIGNNFTDPCAMDLSLDILHKSWLQVMCEELGFAEYNGHCWFMSHWIFDKLDEAIPYLVPHANRNVYKEWSINKLDMAMKRKELVSDSKYFRGVNHPYGPGHRVWANYLFQHIKIF